MSLNTTEAFQLLWQWNCLRLSRRSINGRGGETQASGSLKASFVATQEFGKKLLELKPPGKIINIASITSFIANGVLRMTEAFSNKWAGKGINVNRICLGELYGIYQGMGKGHH